MVWTCGRQRILVEKSVRRHACMHALSASCMLTRLEWNPARSIDSHPPGALHESANAPDRCNKRRATYVVDDTTQARLTKKRAAP